MKIATKIVISTILLLILTTGVVTTIVIVSIKGRQESNLKNFRDSEYTRVKHKLQSLVDVTFESVESTYENSADKDFIEHTYGKRLVSIIDTAYSQLEDIYKSYQAGNMTENQAKAQAMAMIKASRYDSGTGYLWINNTEKPLARMVMHPIAPQLDGQTLSSEKYNVADGGKNIFTAMIDEVADDGHGFVGYLWPKPGKDKPQPKLSYVKLFEPWDWIIGTGIYVDDASEEAMKGALSQMAKFRYDGGTGYFWINDTSSPYPKMVMHPIAPQLDGKEMNDSKYNVAKDKKNFFVAMVEEVQDDGEGFVAYLWPKPGKDEPQPKMSFVKLFKPMNWIIGTGVYTDDIEDTILARTAELNSKTNALIGKIIMVAVFMIVIGAVITVFVARGIASSVNKTAEILEDLSQGTGDLTKRLDGGTTGETKALSMSFNKVLDNLDASFTQLLKSLAGTSESLVPIIRATDTVNDSLSNTSVLAEQVATAAEQLSSSITDIANSTSSAAIQNEEVVNISNKGSEIIKKSEHISATMRSKIGTLTDEIKELTTNASEIENVITVINDISEQTNMLALNAAIEAARAGEAGRGFAVVADEVRKLAEKTQDSTEDIRKMVKEMQNRVGTANSEAKIVTGLVQEQTEIDAQTSENFSHILEAVSSLQENILSVSSAVDQQSAVTTQIAANIETVAGSSGKSKDDLNMLVGNIRSLVDSIMQTSTIFSNYKMRDKSSLFAMAKLQHLIYLNKLYAIYQGTRKETADIEVDHHNCAFGKFYYSAGEELYGKLPEFKEIEPLHIQVHSGSHAVVRYVKEDNKAAAKEKLYEVFDTAERLLSKLNTILNRQ